MNPVIEIDLDAIRANYREFRRVLDVDIVPVVKADAYGHGALAVAQAVAGAGAPMIGVADAREGIALRDAGIAAPILAWLHSPQQDWDAVLEAGLEVGLSSFDSLALLGDSASAGRPARVHLKLDTGLGRNGARACDWRALFAQALELERAGRIRVAGVFSHLAGAGADADLAQIAEFDRAWRLAHEVGLEPERRHLAATGAALQYPQARYDFVRLGIGLYGLSPFGPEQDPGIELRPALQLRAPIRRLSAEDAETAGAGWCTPVGSAAGLPPILHDLPALADDRGERWRAVRVEPSRTLLEPADDPAAAPALELVDDGAERTVVLIDRAPDRSATADDWAAAAGTINYEVTTRLSGRIHRAYLEPEPLQLALGDGNRVPGVLAPVRRAVVDLDLIRSRFDGWSAAVDLGEDAYGHGADVLLPLVLEAGLSPVARSLAGVEALRELGASDPRLLPDAPDATRTIYGFDRAAGAPAIRLYTELLGVKRVEPGQAVSYGYAWRAAAPTTLGLVPLGYADAIPRSAFGRARVCVDGVPVPVVGRVAMDQVVVDLGDIDCWPGALVTVWGSGDGEPDLHDWADWTGQPAEALCGALGSRVERAYSGEPYVDARGFGSRSQGVQA
ncbi:alanine racemase [Gulosibacter sp. 10]|uniref:alanine racemase n=1 Tax=Gulosibacter sp. 10 TaxID=1255570 RepID=UPI00097EAA94|nr:alanine racemase [Gulosibacter sp. 10]SJM58335.1 Alanine racemase [Gulosibacter sp. 10]